MTDLREALQENELADLRETLQERGEGRQRALLALRQAEDKLTKAVRHAHGRVSITEIARLTGISRPTVYSRLEESEAEDNEKGSGSECSG